MGAKADHQFVFIPHHGQVDQSSVDFSSVSNAWLWFQKSVAGQSRRAKLLRDLQDRLLLPFRADDNLQLELSWFF
jgi:hypothetical protein